MQQCRIFGETLHQDLACAIQCRFGIGNTGVIDTIGLERRFQVFRRFFFRIQARIGQQGVGQRRQSCFGSNLCLGAAFLLVRQVQVFEAGLVFRVHDGVQQWRRHLALLVDRSHDRGAALFQLAQVAQPLFQQAQLDIIEPAGRFLPVTGDKWHGRAFIQ